MSLIKKTSILIISPLIFSQVSFAEKIKLNREIKSISLQGPENKESVIPKRNKNYKVIYFGFTKCPDVCPMTLSKLTTIMKKKDLFKKSEVYFINLDWEEDDGKSANEYAQNFGNHVYGYSGTKEQIEGTSSYFRAYFNYKDGVNKGDLKNVDHSSFLYLVSPENKLLKVYPSSKDLNTFADFIK